MLRHRPRMLPYAFKAIKNTPSTCRFDTDSFKIVVDNFASQCMANNKAYFEHLVLHREQTQNVRGISKGLDIVGTGTFIFDIKDDEGGLHTIKIKNSLYVPELRFCLLLPQHWAQEAGDEYPHLRGTWMENNANNCTLFWRQGKHKKTIPFDLQTNMPVFRTASWTNSY